MKAKTKTLLQQERYREVQRTPQGTIHRLNHFLEISGNVEISAISENPFFCAVQNLCRSVCRIETFPHAKFYISVQRIDGCMCQKKPVFIAPLGRLYQPSFSSDSFQTQQKIVIIINTKQIIKRTKPNSNFNMFLYRCENFKPVRHMYWPFRIPSVKPVWFQMPQIQRTLRQQFATSQKFFRPKLFRHVLAMMRCRIFVTQKVY